MNEDDAPPPEGRSDHRPVARPKLVHGKRMVKGACGAWHTQRSVLFEMNELHVDFRQVLFEHFRALLESNDEAFVCRLADYVRWILSMAHVVQNTLFWGTLNAIGCFRLRPVSNRCACV